MSDLERELKELEIDDYIWIIFYFIVTFALLSNFLEKRWLLHHHKEDYHMFKNINVVLLVISFLIYFYFVILSYSKYKRAKRLKNIKELYLKEISFVAATLFLIGGILYIYCETESRDDIDIIL